MKKLALLALVLLCTFCKSKAQDSHNNTQSYPVTKTNAEWKTQLTASQFYVLRQAGTERPFTSPLNKNYAPGIYNCVACKTPLFKSDHKFDSGTGWPSFDQGIKGNIAYSSDTKIGYTRTEEHCATCGGHLGHVFNDGPRATTGKRHCINGVALEFVPTE